MKTYMITFATGAADISGLNLFVQYDPRIAAYWNYVPFVYCVKTGFTSADLAAALTRFFPDGNFFVAEINPLNINGRLPDAAWRWFYSSRPERNRLADPESPFTTPER